MNLNNAKIFLSSLYNFEDALLHFTGHPHMKEVRQLLGMRIITNNADPESNCVIVASHESTLSLYDFQKICSVLCAYRLFEIISLRGDCIPRAPCSSPVASMFLPGPSTAKSDLDVSVMSMSYYFSDAFSGILPPARMAEPSCDISAVGEKCGRRHFIVSHIS